MGNKVFIIHMDIPYEFGEVMDVCSSLKNAFEEMCKYYRQDSTTDPDDWTIQEWNVDVGCVQVFELEKIEDRFQLRKLEGGNRTTFLTEEDINEMSNMRE